MICRIERGGVGTLEGGTISAVVVTVTVDVTDVTPSAGVTEAGAGVHVADAGAPVQASATAELNPPIGVTVTVKVAELPAVTVAVAGAVTVKLVTASFATKASDGPFKFVWNAGGDAVAGGKTGKLLAVEKVSPVMYALGGFDASSAMAKPCSRSFPFPLPPKNVEYIKSAAPLPLGLILDTKPFAFAPGYTGSTAPSVTGKSVESVEPTT